MSIIDAKYNDELINVAPDKKDEALRRVGIIQTFNKFAVLAAKDGVGRNEALAMFSANGKVRKRSLQRWIYHYRQEGLLGLVDKRGGGRFSNEIISQEAFELFKSMYLTMQQLPMKVCWQNVKFINSSENKGWKVPDLQMMYRIVKHRIPLPALVLHREGLKSYEAKCAPYVEIEPDSVRPGEVFVGDHSQFNVWVRDRNKWVRPWITAWEDMKSRAIVGWHISIQPNQSTILRAIKPAIENYGPPESVKIDNGRDYDSEMLTGITKTQRKSLRKGYLDEQMLAGIFTMLDITVSFAIPYNAKAKRIERLFATIDSQFAKTFDLYCGKDTIRKPEDLVKKLQDPEIIKSAITFEKFERLFNQYADTYNNSIHNIEELEGMSPAEVLAGRTTHRILAEGVLDLLMRVWSRELVVGKNGVQIKGIFYGQYDIQLAAWQGKKVRAAYNPDDMRRVYIYDASTLKLLTIAEQNQLVNYGKSISEENLRDAMRQKRRMFRVAKEFRDGELTRNMDLTTLTIRAMKEAEQTRINPPHGRRASTDSHGQVLKPVRTALDSQVKEHQRQEIVQSLRKAAGAESMKTSLDFDFSLLKRNRSNRVRLFDG